VANQNDEAGAQLSPRDLIAVSAAKAAQLLGISERHFHDQRKLPGFPPGRTLGRAVRWNPRELEGWFLNLPIEQRQEPKQLAARRYRDGRLVDDDSEDSA
jgi:predicted DNA-binding transcriptional regulator AlpA